MSYLIRSPEDQFSPVTAQIILQGQSNQSVSSSLWLNTQDLTLQQDRVNRDASLFVLRFKVPVNIFSVMSGWSQYFLGIEQYFGDIMCLTLGHFHYINSPMQYAKFVLALKMKIFN